MEHSTQFLDSKKTMTFFSNITRKPSFWIFQIFFFFLCVGFSIHFYPKAFPILDLTLKMDRRGALEKARAFAEKNHWKPTSFNQTASFSGDHSTQTYVELTQGGSAAFHKLIQEKLYSPYSWNVRHFQEGNSEETKIQFTPAGEIYGFIEKLSENSPGASLTAQQALQIGQLTAVRDFGIDLSAFELIEKSFENKPSHRVDHTFVFERKNTSLGEARFRLKLVVSGDRLTELTHFIKIPESFRRHYSEMRSSNEIITSAATIGMALFYWLGGCGIALLILARKRWVLWKTPLMCALIVGLFQLFEQLNQYPLIWMHYDTALSSRSFITQTLLSSFIYFLFDTLLLFITFMSAESLSRAAFGHHPQLWNVWSRQSGSSLEVLGRTIGGYLSVGFFCAFIVGIYLFGTRILGWWTPSDTLFQPDHLATLFPWFTSIAHSLHAGFWEECLFRAVPLAGAAWIGSRLGHRKKWILAAFLFQAILFAAAHANYPAQPSYARVIELIIPSFVFGGIYLIFGLLPGIILHFTFDAILFSIPLFTAQSPGIIKDRVLVILFALIPLWISLYHRVRNKKWSSLQATGYNRTWRPQAVGEKTQTKPTVHAFTPHSPALAIGLAILSAILLGVWLFKFRPTLKLEALETSREQAIRVAESALIQQGVHFSQDWEALAFTSSGVSNEDRFIWVQEGEACYQSLKGSYLSPSHWVVRFVRFNAPVAERAEEYQVFIAGKDRVYRIRHELPEARSGSQLSLEKARPIARAAVKTAYALPQKNLKEVTSQAHQLPNRRDWLFVFSDSAVKLKEGEARVGIQLGGDQVLASKRFIFIPEDWLRKERSEASQMGILKTISTIFLIFILLIGIALSILKWVSQTSKKDLKPLAKLSSLFVALCTFNQWNEMPGFLAGLNTTQPKIHQMMNHFGFGILKTLFFAVTSAWLIQFFKEEEIQKQKHPLWISLLYGSSLGVLGVLLPQLFLKFLPQQDPLTGNLSALDHTFPSLSVLNELEGLILLGILFLTLHSLALRMTHHWTRRSLLGAVFLGLCGLALSGILSKTFINWGISGVCFGIFLNLSLRFFALGHQRIIPLAVSCALILSELRQIQLASYLGAEMHSLISILFIGAAGLLWYRYEAD